MLIAYGEKNKRDGNYCLVLAAVVVISVAMPASGQQLDLDDINPFGDEPATQPSDVAPAEEGAEGQPPTERTAEDVFNEGKQLAEEGRCAEAIELFSQILAVSPNYVPAALERGKCFSELGEYQLALESLGLAVNYGIRFPDIYAESLAERGKVLLQLGNYQEAADDFSLAVQSKTSNAEYLFLRGKALIRLGQTPTASFAGGTADYYTQALASLKRAVEIDESYAEAYGERGNAYASLLDFDKAVGDLERAVVLDQESSKHKAQLGFVLLRRADNERRMHDVDLSQVVSDYRKAIESFGEYLAIEGDKDPSEFEEAEPEFIKPDQVYLGRAVAQISLANELPEAGRQRFYQAAVVDSERALEYDENAVTAVYQKGVAQRLMGDLATAADSFSDALQMSSGFSEARLRRGIVYYYMGELASARGDFETVIQQTENPDGRAEFWIGVTHAKEGNYQDAIWFYTKSLRLNPSYKPAYNNRGLAHLKLGEFERAAKDFDELIRRNRNDSVARQRRDLARRMMNQAQ